MIIISLNSLNQMMCNSGTELLVLSKRSLNLKRQFNNNDTQPN